MNRHGLRLVGHRILVVAVGFALAGCGGGAAATLTGEANPASVPAGFEWFDGSANGFGVALPAVWVPIDLSREDRDAMLQLAMESVGPQARDLLAGLDPNRPPPALLALDPAGFPNVNVLVGDPISQSRFEAQMQGLLPQFNSATGFSMLSADRVDDVSGRYAFRIVWKATYFSQPVEQHQYWVLGQYRHYVVTFTASDPGEDREVFPQVMSTLALFRPR